MGMGHQNGKPQKLLTLIYKPIFVKQERFLFFWGGGGSNFAISVMKPFTILLSETFKSLHVLLFWPAMIYFKKLEMLKMNVKHQLYTVHTCEISLTLT